MKLLKESKKEALCRLSENIETLPMQNGSEKEINSAGVLRAIVSWFSFPAFLLLVCIVLISCSDALGETDYEPTFSTESSITKPVYIFGVLPSSNRKRMHKLFSPMMDYLSKNIDGVHFVVETSKNFPTFDAKVADRKFHFIFSNPYQTSLAIDGGYHVFGKLRGDEDFRGLIVVRKDSGINHVSDLKGHVLSFPGPTALAGSMLPLYYLQTHGLDVRKDIKVRFVGSHQSSIMNVYLGNVKAGGTWPLVWRILLKERPEYQDELKVIWETENLPSLGLSARDDVPADIVKQVQALMLNMRRDPEGRKLVRRSGGWEEANDDTYQSVREFMKRYRKTVIPSDDLWETE